MKMYQGLIERCKKDARVAVGICVRGDGNLKTFGDRLDVLMLVEDQKDLCTVIDEVVGKCYTGSREAIVNMGKDSMMEAEYSNDDLVEVPEWENEVIPNEAALNQLYMIMAASNISDAVNLSRIETGFVCVAQLSDALRNTFYGQMAMDRPKPLQH